MNLEEISHRLLSALVNGGYQGILLTLLVALGMKLIPRTNAATRHFVWFGTLLGVAVLPLAHFLFANPQVNPAGIVPATSTDNSIAQNPADRLIGIPGVRSIPVEIEPESRLTPKPWWTVEEKSSPLAHGAYGEVIDWGAAPNPNVDTGEHDRSSHFPQRSERREFSGSLPVARINLTPTETGGAAMVEPQPPSFWQRLGSLFSIHGQLALPRRAAEALIVAWMIAAAYGLSRLVRQWLELRALKQSGIEAPEAWQTVFTDLGAEMGLRRKTRLIIGPAGSVPLVAGFWRPAVVLPAGMFDHAAAPQLHQVLRHELGHVIRRDDWANLLQQVIKAVLFFHPAVRWLSERITLEREIACDDHVLAATRTPRAYALWLIDFAGRRQHREIAAAPAAWNQQTQLKERITMILDSKRNASTRLALARAGVVLAVGTLCTGWVLQAGPRVALTVASTEPVAPVETVTTIDESVEVDANATIEANVQTIVSPSGASLAVWTEHPSSVALAGDSGTVSVSSGPREKTTVRIAPPAPAAALPATAPAPVAAPSPAKAPVVALHPVPPAKNLFASNSSENEGSSAKASSGKTKVKDSDEASLERRLARLERMVEKLSKLGDSKHFAELNELALKFQHDFSPVKVTGLTEKLKQSGKLAEKAGLSEAEIARIHAQAEREAQRAMRDIERATQEQIRADTTARSGSHSDQREAQIPDQRRELQVQRKALESARKSLEQQMQVLERQIEKLEESQEQLDEQLKELEGQKSSADHPKSDEKPASPKPPTEPKKVEN